MSGARRRWRACLGAGLLLLLAPLAQAEGPLEDYFPLTTGLTWSYHLVVTNGADRQEILYTSRVARTERVEGADWVVVEARSDDKLLQTTWYHPDGEVLRNPRRQNGRTIHELREAEGGAGRVFLTAEALRAEQGRWAWASGDGAAQGTIEVVGREQIRLPKPLRAEFDCLVVVERGEFKAGGRTATQVRRLWLAAGVGVVKETSEISLGDAAPTSTSEAYLIAYPR